MSEKKIYEIGFLINPNLSQQEAEKSHDKVKNIIEKNSASVISEGEIVDIDLAYQIVTKIASKNERFDEAYFSWIKFVSETKNIAEIKKEVDKIKKEIFRYLITKTVEDDSLTDRYKNLDESEKKDNDNEVDDLGDDLTKIEGIGPVIAEKLNSAGINTYQDLAERTVDEIKEIIIEVAGSHDPETWADQAKLAANGEWDKLIEWQKELQAGKEVN